MNSVVSSLIFLGTGASLGVPVLGCTCSVCRGGSPFNRRTRSSGLFKIGDKRLLLDVGPDFRQQALRHQVTHLDGVLFTHAHQDHVAGIDDLRVYSFWTKRPLEALASHETASDLRARFGYMFKDRPLEGGIPSLFLAELEAKEGEVIFQDVPFRYFSYQQTGMKVTGFRVGNIAYVTDIQTYSDEIFYPLEGIETLVVSALRQSSSRMHLSVEEASLFGQKTGAKHIYLTHLSHDLDYDTANRRLPSGVKLAYDGLEIPFLGVRV